jgi:hypothetical protein
MSRQVPPQRLAAFAVIADATRIGPVVLVVRDRVIRRQYLRGVARCGGNVGNLVFSVTPNASDALADELRVRVGERCEIVNVRELRPGGGQG